MTPQEAAQAARLALRELDDDVFRLVVACEDAFFESDTDVCLGVAQQASNFVNNVAPAQIAKLAAGDVDAGRRLQRSLTTIRNAVVDEANRTETALSAGGLAHRFVSEVIVQSAKEAAELAAVGGGVAAVVGAVALGVYVALLRR